MKSSELEEISIVKLCHSTSSNMAIMEFEGLGTEYFDDSDKEVDLAIDPVWEAQQISTFTAWCNAHLRKAEMRIDSFERDFRSGLKLMKLLEIISNSTLPTPDKGRMRFHKIANVNKCLKFIEDHGVRMASIGAEEIVDGNVKMTLGMIWTIILRFSIQDILVEDFSAREGLLLWCKRKTNGYKNIKVENFKNSFQDGLVFCALLHSYDKSLLEYDSLSPKNVAANLDLAFSVAEKHLDVPKMLSIEDMVQNKDSDEKSIMAYVSSYYHAIEKREKIFAAANNICKIVSKELKDNQYVTHCEAISDNLIQWIKGWTNEFQNRLPTDDMPYLNNKFQNFKNYKDVDKPQKQKDKIQLQFATLSISNDKINTKNIQKKWDEMEKLENIYEEYLSDQFHQNDLIRNLLDKFESNFQIQRAWISSRIDLFVSKDYENANLSELKILKRAQETFESDVQSQKTRRDKIINIANELRRLNFQDMEMIEQKLNIVSSPWETLDHLHHQRTENISMYLNAMIRIDDLQLEFAKRVVPLFDWAQLAIEDLCDSIMYHSVDEIKDLIKAQNDFKSTVDEAKDELCYVTSVNDEICRIISITGIQRVPLNPYTDVILQDMQKTWIHLEQNILERDNALQEALSRQMSIKEYKENFAKLSSSVAEELGEIEISLYELLSSKVKTNKSQAVFQSLRGKLENCFFNLKGIDLITQKLMEYSMFDKSKMCYSVAQLNAIYEILKQLLSENSISSFNHISPDRTDSSASIDLDEYKSCFKHFDKSNSNQLDPSQFRACMLSLGYPLQENDQDDAQIQDMLTVLDPENTGFVTLYSFLDYFSRRNSRTDNKELLIESFKTLANNQDAISRNTVIKELPQKIADYCIENMPVKISSNGDSECYLDYNSLGEKLFNGQPDLQVNGSA